MTNNRVLRSILVLGLAATLAAPSYASVTFTERAEDAGISLIHDPLGAVVDGVIQSNLYGSGLAWTDMNHDGWPDLVVANGQGGTSVYLNEGDGTFEDVSHFLGANLGRAANGLAMADMDNDGFSELGIANFYGEPFFYRGASRAFTENSEQVGVSPLLFAPGETPPVGWVGPESMGLAFGDVDADGDLDIYVANYRLQPDMLLESLAGGFFVKTDKVDVLDTGWGFQPVFLDFDNDADIDIFVANDFGRNFLFVNGGAASGYTFEQRANDFKVSGGGGYPAPSSLTMGVAVGDYDNDLDLDIYVTNYIQNELYENAGPVGEAWRFNARGAAKGVQYMYNSWGTEFFDADNDGDLDLCLTGGWIQSADILDQGRNIDNRFYLNNGAPDFDFTDITETSGFGDTANSGRGLALADYDRDGDLDIAVWNGSHYDPGPEDPDAVFQAGPFQLFRNDQNEGNHWVVFQLEGAVHDQGNTNRSGVGARVYLTTGNGTQLREVRAGGSFLSQSSLELEFGLGNATTIDEVKVRWTDGTEEIFEGCEVDRFYRLVEGAGAPLPLSAAITRFDATPQRDGVQLRWSLGAWLDLVRLNLLRRPNEVGSEWTLLEIPATNGQALDESAEVGAEYVYRLEIVADDGLTTSAAEVIVKATGSPATRPTLGQNFPNPFNPGTTILYSVPGTTRVTLRILDARGRRVKTLVREERDAGRYEARWDGTDEDGNRVASGSYMYVLETAAGSVSRSLTLVR